jgi:hypothetical protein
VQHQQQGRIGIASHHQYIVMAVWFGQGSDTLYPASGINFRFTNGFDKRQLVDVWVIGLVEDVQIIVKVENQTGLNGPLINVLLNGFPQPLRQVTLERWSAHDTRSFYSHRLQGISIANALRIEIEIGTRGIRQSGGLGCTLGLDGSFHGRLVGFLVKDHHHDQGYETVGVSIKELFPGSHQAPIETLGVEILAHSVQPSHDILYQHRTLTRRVVRGVHFAVGHTIPCTLVKT